MLRLVNSVALGCMGLLLAGGGTPGAAQQVDPGRIIDFHVNLEEFNQSVGGSVKEGGRYTMTIKDRGTYALTAVVTDAAAQRVTVTLLRAADRSEEFRPIETVRATVGKPAPLKSIPLASVVVEGFRRVQVSGRDAQPSFLLAANTRQPAIPVAPIRAFGTCCVTCGSVEACGCAVKMECGNCCSDGCCPPIRIEANSTRTTPAPTYYQFTKADCRKPVRDEERLFTRPERVHRVAFRES